MASVRLTTFSLWKTDWTWLFMMPSVMARSALREFFRRQMFGKVLRRRRATGMRSPRGLRGCNGTISRTDEHPPINVLVAAVGREHFRYTSDGTLTDNL